MNNSNKREKLEKQQLLFQMKKDVESLERQIKYSRLTNLKISSVKNLKITARALQLVAPYVLTAGVVIGGFCLIDETPFYRDERKIYSSTMTEFDNLDNIRYEQKYGDFNQDNVFNHYSQWELQEDGSYTRTIKTYNIKEKTYDELVNLLHKENLSLEDVFGESTSTIKETKNNLSDDEINEEAFMQAVIYNKDKEDYIIGKETMSENISFSALCVVLTVIAELIPAYIRDEFSSFSFAECVENIKEKYQSVDSKDLTRKLEIRRDNYNRMLR